MNLNFKIRQFISIKTKYNTLSICFIKYVVKINYLPSLEIVFHLTFKLIKKYSYFYYHKLYYTIFYGEQQRYVQLNRRPSQ